MKNIHLIQTDKPRTYKGEKVSTFTAVSSMMPTEFVSNIYITSDEEIKEGDWVYCNDDNTVIQLDTNLSVMLANQQKEKYGFKTFYKIILTTDQDLIENGVQAIGDGFLEWFVKNPTCEEVEVEHTYISFELNKPTSKYYKIILPKKNFYCGDKSDYDEQCLEQCENCVDAKGVDYGYLSKEQQKKHIINMMEKDQELWLYEESKDPLCDCERPDYFCDCLLYDEKIKEEPKQEIKLEDIFNDEKRQGVKDLIDAHKQRLEKYSDRFDNDKSEIGNPDTWGKRVIEEPKQENCCTPVGQIKRYIDCIGCDCKPKQETLEEAAENYGWRIKTNTFSNPVKANDLANSAKQDFIEGAKWQQKRRYSEEDLFKILLDFVAFPHDHMEPRGSIIERYLKELKNK